MFRLLARQSCYRPRASRSYHLKHLSPHLGVEILDGQDLISSPDMIYALLQKNHVLIFRDVDVSPQMHVDLAQSFGPTEPPHPVYPSISVNGCPITVLENDADRPPDTAEWHQDCTWSPNPPFLSVLHAVSLPDVGGDTLWASAYAVFESLSPHMQNHLEGLSAVHDCGSFRNSFASDDTIMTQRIAEVGSAVHPMVQQHPSSGQKYLAVNESFTTHVLGLSRPDSDQLLQYLYERIRRPEFQVRIRWEPDSVAIWQNWGTQHYAVSDYFPKHRRMQRITVLEDGRLHPS